VPNFVSFAATNAELAHGEKIAYLITHSPSLFDAPGTKVEFQTFSTLALSLERHSA